jgi:hypothetical protein
MFSVIQHKMVGFLDLILTWTVTARLRETKRLVVGQDPRRTRRIHPTKAHLYPCRNTKSLRFFQSAQKILKTSTIPSSGETVSTPGIIAKIVRQVRTV